MSDSDDDDDDDAADEELLRTLQLDAIRKETDALAAVKLHTATLKSAGGSGGGGGAGGALQWPPGQRVQW